MIRQSLFRRGSTILLQLLCVVVAIMAISAYQARNLLANDQQAAPSLRSNTMQEEDFELARLRGQPVLIYFFAPWCPYCSASVDNVVRLRRLRSEDELAIVAVALEWQDRDQIRDYASEHDMNMPVVMGTGEQAINWKVHGFPTYYVLDSEHRVVHRDIGYATQLGLFWRSWLVQ